MRPKAIFIAPTSDIYQPTINGAPDWSIWRIPPLGLISIISSLNNKGFQANLIDCYELGFTLRTRHIEPLVGQIIERSQPFLTGLSVSTATFDHARSLARLIKERHPAGTLIAGGPHPSVEPELTLRQVPWLDAVCIGPGEEVCQDIMNGIALDRIPGLMTRGCEPHYTPRPPVQDLDDLPFPDFRLVDYSFYLDYSVWISWFGRNAFLVSARGCPHSCRFCASQLNRPLRYHSADYIMELARYLSGFPVDMLVFCDETLAFHPGRLAEICEKFINSGLFRPKGRLRWRASLHTDEVQPDLLRLMKRAGCMQVGIGIESGSDRILQTLNKNTTVEANKQACLQVEQAGLDLLIAFMIGSPGETEDDIRQTLDFVRNVECSSKACFAFTPMPGSHFYDEFTRNGLIDRQSIDWCDLASAAAPKSLFCDVEQSRLTELFSKGMAMSSAANRVLVHGNVADLCPPLIRQVREKHDVVIVRSDDDLKRVKTSDRIANAWAKTRVGKYLSGPRPLSKIPGKIREFVQNHVANNHNPA